MHDEREWWRPYVAAVEVVRASGAERTQNSYCSAHQAEVGEWTAPRDPMPEGVGAAAVRIPITPGWDLRPGADLPHFDRLIRLTPKTLLGWASKIRAGVADVFAAQSAYMLRHCIVAGAIVAAFGLGWFCGWTSGSSPTAGAETLSRTATHRLKNGMLRSPAVLGATRQLPRLLVRTPVFLRRTRLKRH